MANREESKLLKISPRDIERNLDNPRILFDEEDLKVLQQSIAKQGILLPLVVYKKPGTDKKWVLLDGERRLMCAKNLGLPKVPANGIDPPSRLQNILHMFNIHNVRKEWELTPIALKLETIMRLLPNGKKTPNAELAKITGLSTTRVTECKRILKFDKKYIDLALHPDPHQRIRGDFFSQLELALEKLDDYTELKQEFPRNKIIDLMIEKYREGTIVNIIQEFRTLRKVLTSPKKGIQKKVIIQNFEAYLKSKPIRDSAGRIKQKAMSVGELFERTSYTVYEESKIIRIGKQLNELLEKYDVESAKDIKNLVKVLNSLRKRIDIILKYA